jgi:transposase
VELHTLCDRGDAVPVLPSSILEPLREEFVALLPEHYDDHPWGCHNPRIPDEVVFDKLMLVLVSGMGYERVADKTCSATTLRRRRDEWIAQGVGEALHLTALTAYDRMIGLELDQLNADGCQTKAPSGGECAGKSPVDRAKQGLKRSELTEAYGIPLVTDPAPASTCDHILLPGTLDHFNDLAKVLGALPEHPALSLDAGYDYRCVYDDLADRGIIPKIAKRGEQTPIQADGRWVVERTNSWMNNFGKLRRCTERRAACVAFFIALASTIVTIRSLIRRAWFLYRWDTRPRSPRIR